MKKIGFLQLTALLLVAFIMASCGFTQPGYGDDQYSERPVRRQVYNDPYYSNTPATTIVRDPYTGRYYEVTPVSPYGYDTYYDPYNTYGNNRYYGSRRSTGYSRNSGYSNSYPRSSQRIETQSQEQSRGSSETINKAKSIIRRD